MKKLGDILYPDDDMGKARANRLHDEVERVHALVCDGGYAVLPIRRLEAKNVMLQEIYGLFPRAGGTPQAEGGVAPTPAAAWGEARLSMHREPLWSAIGRKLCELGCGVAFAHLQGAIAGGGQLAAPKKRGRKPKPSAAAQARSETAAAGEVKAPKAAKGAKPRSRAPTGKTAAAEKTRLGEAKATPRKRTQAAETAATAGTRLGAANVPFP